MRRCWPTAQVCGGRVGQRSMCMRKHALQPHDMRLRCCPHAHPL
jgi:hypothetical protein